MVVALASVSVAATPPSADSEYARGKAALKGGDSAQALEAFKSGLALAGEDEGTRWQLVLAIGLTYEEGGMPHHAVEYYQRFLNQSEQHRDALSPKWNKRRTLVQGNISRLEKRMAATFGYVTVASEPTGVQVHINGQRAGADADAVTPVGFYLPAGTHTASLRLAGHKLAEQTFELAAGKIRPLRFVLEPEPIKATVGLEEPKAEPLAPKGFHPLPVDDPPQSALDAAVSATASLEPEGPGPNVGAWIVIGTAGALTIASVVSAFLAAEERDEWNIYAADLESGWFSASSGNDLVWIDDEWRRYEEKVQSADTLTGVFGGLAGAALTGGLLWLLLDSDEGDTADETSAPALTLTPTAGGALGHFSWGF